MIPYVLILVVMEDALALEPNWLSIKEASVLILVVMEDALAQRKEEYLEKSILAK